ncbi:MAG TPA: sugar ABC transporter substrate-binding protein [Solirubrobacterales bacterium]|jgi:ribose transport system substrate-binding protein|nr:sugar ABC transporter substrate-binding protein [Solirubrobacterales bacterium]
MKSKLYLLCAVLVLAGLLTACGGGGSSSSSTTSAASSGESAAGSGGSEEASSGGDAVLTAAKKSAVESSETPTTIEATEFGPVTPKKGALIYFIGCDQSIPGCVAQVKGFEAAADAAGYSTKVCDAKFEVAAFQNCMSQAVQASPAAIVNNARPQSDAPEAYKKAHEANIPVFGQFTAEEPEPKEGNAGEVGYVCEHEAELLAQQIIAQTNGEANVAIFADTVYQCNQQRAKGLEKVLSECSGCSVDSESFSAATMQTDLGPAIQATIQREPELDWIVAAPGAAGSLAAASVREAGKSEEISIGTFDGEEPELELLRKEEIVKLDVLSGIYENGWCVVDLISRYLAGSPVPGGIENPTQQVLTTSNVPAEGSFEGAENYEEQFTKLWGAS